MHQCVCKCCSIQVVCSLVQWEQEESCIAALGNLTGYVLLHWSHEQCTQIDGVAMKTAGAEGVPGDRGIAGGQLPVAPAASPAGLRPGGHCAPPQAASGCALFIT